MVEIKSTKQQKYTLNYVPHDVIENVLVRLAVKSLLRFRAVSKQWQATVSNPKFAETHLRQFNNSSRQNLLAWDGCKYGEIRVVKLENDRFRVLSAIEYPHEEGCFGVGILCYCDGLILKRCGSGYVLWNLSSRTYKKFSCPYPIDDHYSKTLYGICYDPLFKDYKVVIADMQHYALLYCKNNKWTEMKEMTEFSCSDELLHCKGASFNGSFYWILTTKRVEEGFRSGFGFEIVCFDWRDEKFKKLRKPDCKENAFFLILTSLGGHLCMLPSVVYAWRNEISMMKKVGDDDESWMEFKVRLPLSCFDYVKPVCLTNENVIMLEVGDPKNYMLYCESKKAFGKISKSSTRLYFRRVPYQENLFLL